MPPRKDACMNPRTITGRVGLCLLLFGAGCTTVSSPDALWSSRGRGGLEGKRSAQADADDTDESESSRGDDSRLSRTASGRGEARRAMPDAATMMLIETELRDLSPAERQEWIAYLSTLEPSAVPHALQARRMQAQQQSAAGRDMGVATTSPGQRSAPAAAWPDPRGPAATSSAAGATSAAAGHSTTYGGYSVTPAAPPGASAARSLLDAPEPIVTAAAPGRLSPFVDAAGYRGLPARTPDLVEQAALSQLSTAAATVQDTRPMSANAMTPTAPQLPVINPGVTYAPVVEQANLVMPAVNPAPQALPVSTSPSNLPPAAAYWQEGLQRLTSLIEAEVAARQPGLSEAERHEYVRWQVRLRMLYLMADQPQRAQQAIPGIDPAEQEFWTGTFWALSNYFDAQAMPDRSERASQTVAQLASASRRLQETARLELRNVNFCFKIDGFGNISRFERDEFRPGQPVALYAEVRNFKSEPTVTGHYRTRLKSAIEIRRGGADGEPVAQNAFPATEDLCRNLRTDYYHSYELHVPPDLSAGPYTLVLTVQDELGGKAATQTLSFLVR
jgi:hypothetical protein